MRSESVRTSPLAFLFLALLCIGCAHQTGPAAATTGPYVLVLGIAQDGGYPQAGCNRDDCAAAWAIPSLRKRVASLAVVDPLSRERWIIEATPDFPSQLRTLDEVAPFGAMSGILITHAHIGHYLGLAQLGREVLGARSVPVYAMPRMSRFLSEHAPWSQLVTLKNIDLRPLQHGVAVPLNERIRVTPLAVPHRDEFSETVAFLVQGPSQTVLWLPDIDKWEKWDTKIEDLVPRVDVAYLDGTFFDERELPGRNLAEIPHPTISESMERLRLLPDGIRRRVRFIHLNQSNRALHDDREITSRGYAVAREGERFPL